MLDPKLLAMISGMFGSGGVQGTGVGVGAGVPSDAGAGANPGLQLPTGIGSAGASGGNNILGMTPTQFMTVMGQVGHAMAPDTDIGRLGMVAANMGMTQLQGLLAKKQQGAFSTYAKDMLERLAPNKIGSLASGLGKLSNMNGLPKLNNTSEEGL